MQNFGTNHGGMHFYDQPKPIKWELDDHNSGEYTGDTLNGQPHG